MEQTNTSPETDAFRAETARAYGTLHIPGAEYRAATVADRAFDRSLSKQFGKGARWRVNRRDYNAETRAAYEAKIAADRALHEAFQKAR